MYYVQEHATCTGSVLWISEGFQDVEAAELLRGEMERETHVTKTWNTYFRVVEAW